MKFKFRKPAASTCHDDDGYMADDEEDSEEDEGEGGELLLGHLLPRRRAALGLKVDKDSLRYRSDLCFVYFISAGRVFQVCLLFRLYLYLFGGRLDRGRRRRRWVQI